jgi:hypothetical protein
MRIVLTFAPITLALSVGSPVQTRIAVKGW